MPRIERIKVGGYVYHVLNRANARACIFNKDKDYESFEAILEEAVAKFDMRLLSYSIMPNHWHLVLYPKKDGDLVKFMSWLTSTHTKKWHLEKNTIGEGHLYQGRYKSFICQNGNHFITLVNYVEQNALKARLVDRAENWKWSSVWRRENGNSEQKKLLSAWPVSIPEDYLLCLNRLQVNSEEEDIEKSILKSKPYGDDVWVVNNVKQFGLEQTLRKVGRPKIKNGA
jgi:putative transposase